MGEASIEKVTESVVRPDSSEMREDRSTEEIIDRWVCKSWVIHLSGRASVVKAVTVTHKKDPGHGIDTHY